MAVEGDATQAGPRVEVEGPGLGMAQIVGNMLEQAIATDPGRARRIRGSLALRASDYDMGVTLHFERERVLVTNIPDTRASVLVEAPAMTLTKLGSGGHGGREYVRRELRVRGALRHPMLLVRVRRLMRAI